MQLRTAERLTCESAEPSSMSFLTVVANSSLVGGGDVTTTLFVRVVGGGRRLGRCVVGTGSAVNKGGAESILLLGAFISVPLAPLGVANRRTSGGVHTHASIVHSSTAASTLDVRHAVISRYGLFVVVDWAWRCRHCNGKKLRVLQTGEHSDLIHCSVP